MSDMNLSLQRIQSWLTDARLVGDAQQIVHRVHTDSRTLQPGDLFVALKGERFDANNFLADVAAQGAALVEHVATQLRVGSEHLIEGFANGGGRDDHGQRVIRIGEAARIRRRHASRVQFDVVRRVVRERDGGLRCNARSRREDAIPDVCEKSGAV